VGPDRLEKLALLIIIGVVGAFALAGGIALVVLEEPALGENQENASDQSDGGGGGGVPPWTPSFYLQVGERIENVYWQHHYVLDYVSSSPEHVLKITVDNEVAEVRTTASVPVFLNDLKFGISPASRDNEMMLRITIEPTGYPHGYVSAGGTLALDLSPFDLPRELVSIKYLESDPEHVFEITVDNETTEVRRERTETGVISTTFNDVRIWITPIRRTADNIPIWSVETWDTEEVHVFPIVIVGEQSSDNYDNIRPPQYAPPHPSLLENGIMVRGPVYPPAPHHSTVVGTQKVLVIQIDFPDQAGTQTREHFESLLFGETNSLRHYYREVSYGQLDIQGTFAGTGWYRSSKNMSWWGDDTDPNYDVDDANGPIYNLAREAIQLADADVDFSVYDANGNGVIEPLELHIIIIHAGHDQAQTANEFDIWSHYYQVVKPLLVVDGVRLSGGGSAGYMMVAEDSPLGVIAHEFGHSLGLPDLYDRTPKRNPDSYGIGDWGLMASGSWLGGGGWRDGSSPAHPCAWSKVFLGWVEPTVITSTTSPIQVQVNQAETAGATVIQLLSNPDGTDDWSWSGGGAGEYFLLEYRRKTGYDSELPGEGLLIWHIDESRGNNDDETHKLVDLEEADGLNELNELEPLGNRGDENDPYYRPRFMNFTPTTNPNSNFYDGTPSWVSIIDIGPRGGTNMTATIDVRPTVYVISTTPAPGATGVRRDQPVSVVFSESMDASREPTLAQTAGMDPGGWSFSGWSTTNIQDDTATWTHYDFRPRGSVTLKVMDYVDSAGNEDAPYSWSFTVAEESVLTLEADETKVAPDETITFSGRLTDATGNGLGNREIVLYEGDTEIRRVTTDSQGDYSVQHPAPSEPGGYTYRAWFEGDGTYDWIYSPYVGVSVGRVYDFSTGAGTDDRRAWEGKLDGLPSSPQAFINATETREASTGDYQKLSASDGDPWVTEKATKNGEYDAQLYRFKIDEDPRRISSLSVEWEGHGEPYEGCKTETWIWNFSNGEWEQLSSKKGTVSDVWLTEEVEMDAQNYVSDGYVYVLARAERYTPEDFSLAVSPSSATVLREDRQPERLRPAQRSLGLILTDLRDPAVHFNDEHLGRLGGHRKSYRVWRRVVEGARGMKKLMIIGVGVAITILVICLYAFQIRFQSSMRKENLNMMVGENVKIILGTEEVILRIENIVDENTAIITVLTSAGDTIFSEEINVGDSVIKTPDTEIKLENVFNEKALVQLIIQGENFLTEKRMLLEGIVVFYPNDNLVFLVLENGDVYELLSREAPWFSYTIPENQLIELGETHSGDIALVSGYISFLPSVWVGENKGIVVSSYKVVEGEQEELLPIGEENMVKIENLLENPELYDNSQVTVEGRVENIRSYIGYAYWYEFYLSDNTGEVEIRTLPCYGIGPASRWENINRLSIRGLALITRGTVQVTGIFSAKEMVIKADQITTRTLWGTEEILPSWMSWTG